MFSKFNITTDLRNLPKRAVTIIPGVHSYPGLEKLLEQYCNRHQVPYCSYEFELCLDLLTTYNRAGGRTHQDFAFWVGY